MCCHKTAEGNTVVLHSVSIWIVLSSQMDNPSPCIKPCRGTRTSWLIATAPYNPITTMRERLEELAVPTRHSQSPLRETESELPV